MNDLDDMLTSLMEEKLPTGQKKKELSKGFVKMQLEASRKFYRQTDNIFQEAFAMLSKRAKFMA